MKISFLVFAFSVVYSSSIFSQNDLDHFRSIQSSHSIGINEITKDSIYAVDISFVNNISDFVFDSAHQVLLSYFALYADEGGKTNYDYVTAYSIKDSKVLWSKLVDRTKEKYDFINGKLFFNSPKYSGLIDVLNDTFIWKSKSNIIIHQDLIARNIVLAPQYKNHESIKVCAALNAINGELLWINNSLELKMGIVSQPIVKGDHMIFMNEHLIHLDLRDGMYWKSENYMNKILGKDEKILGEIGLSILSSAIGFGVASALGSTLIPYSIIDMGPAGLKTNAPLYIDDSGFIYAIGIEGMRKYNKVGEMLVSIGHTNRKSIEKILIARDKMYYTDPGNCIINNVKRSFSNSFFYLSELSSNLNTEKSIHLADDYESLYKELGFFHVKTEYFNDTFYALFRNGLLAIDTNLKIIGKYTKTKKEDPEYRNLLGGNFYEISDTIWLKKSYNVGQIYLERLDKSIDVVNSNCQFIRNIPKNAIYKIYYQDDLITAVVNADGKSFLLDKTDKPIIDMLRLEKVLKHNDHYYIANLNGYYIIKKDQLVK